MDQNSSKPNDWLDGTAVALSALCLLHCLALPLLVAGLPFLAQFSAGHLHAQVLVLVLPLSSIALALGFRRHRDMRIVFGGALGMLLLVIGATIAHVHLGLLADRVFTICGSIVLATAHLLNSRIHLGHG
ncbi:MAG: MerC domain-containing protein [Gammaproteobacteria bacterium]|nr:MerC domain-containing protein [Gammaproteobacteria bacterium]